MTVKTADHWVKDESLAPKGRLMIEWAEEHMPVLLAIRKRFEKEKPLEGQRISACLHVTKETGALARTLIQGGAELRLCGSNPLSTQDEVAAALARDGVSVFGFRGQSAKEYYQCIAHALAHEPTMTMDDGADLVSTLHKLAYREQGSEIETVREVLKGLDAEKLVEDVISGTEETTTGVVRLRAMAAKGVLKYPIIAVNDAQSKNLFDNPVGTGQSTLDGIMRATNILIAGKDVVVIGYGQVGSGIAERARGLGAKVTVVEVNPVRALRAVMFGYRVEPLSKASEHGDIFITATGNINVIRGEHMKEMKDGALLCNSGHFDVEICKPDLEKLTARKERINFCTEKHMLKNNRSLYLLAEGRLVNLACGEGHPSEIMDLSFAIQALSVEYAIKSAGKLERTVIPVPKEIDERVAHLKLETMGLSIDRLTEDQMEYLASWTTGTEQS
ncbi:MAG: adenosylhomocysteinase [Aigarchaeota archaeon]|nr:adenosylhomocysteinase [Aigarchaeota archaeon]